MIGLQIYHPSTTCWLGRRGLIALAESNDFKVSFFQFNTYYPKHENRLVRYIRSRKEYIQTPILNSDLSLNSERLKSLGKLHQSINKLLHNFFPIRLTGNILYNLVNGDEKVLAAFFIKK